LTTVPLQDRAAIALFAAEHDLPAGFADLADRLHRPLADRITVETVGRNGPLIVGLCGPQGAGKSTLVSLVAELLKHRGLATAFLSLDDLYRTRAERQALASTVHPLLMTRGVPGTHDVALGHAVLDALGRQGPVVLPRFDKAADDRAPPCEAAGVEGPVDVVLLEGWCVGARAQPPEALTEPVNDLERDEDPQGIWRTFANNALAVDYAGLFERIDLMAALIAPDFATVRRWRGEQEARLADRRARMGLDLSGLMDPPALDRFVGHYQRLTTWIAEDLPPRAEIVVRLNVERGPEAIEGL